MKFPLWIKPAAYGAVAGAIAVAVLGFSWGGWITGTTAQDRVTTAADASRADLAAAICVQNFVADEDARANLVELVALRSTQQRTFIEDGNWAVMPDREGAARDTATLCARMLAEIDPEELPVISEGQIVEEGEVAEPTDEAAPLAEVAPAEAVEPLPQAQPTAEDVEAQVDAEIEAANEPEVTP